MSNMKNSTNYKTTTTIIKPYKIEDTNNDYNTTKEEDNTNTTTTKEEEEEHEEQTESSSDSDQTYNIPPPPPDTPYYNTEIQSQHFLDTTSQSPDTNVTSSQTTIHDSSSTMHHDEPVSSYKCTFCHRVFTRIYNYHRHLDTHKKLPQCYPCWHCQKGFTRKGVLLRHVKEVHEFVNSERIKCPECPKYFKFKTSLANHLDIHKNNTFTCEICHKIFRCKRYLKTHMQRHSSILHACKICGKLFAAHVDVLKHYKIHKDKFECVKCNVIFPTIASRLVHCCSMKAFKRRFRCSDQMAAQFVEEIRHLNSIGVRPSTQQSLEILAKSVPAHLCTEHILFGLGARFDLRFRSARKRSLSPPPPPPSTPPPPPIPMLHSNDFTPVFSSNNVQNHVDPSFINTQIVEPNSFVKFPRTATSVCVPKEFLPPSSQVHWYLTKNIQTIFDSSVENKKKEIIENIKDASAQGTDHLTVDFNAHSEAQMMVTISKSLEDLGFQCWNYRDIHTKQGASFYTLRVEWGHLSAAH